MWEDDGIKEYKMNHMVLQRFDIIVAEDIFPTSTLRQYM